MKKLYKLNKTISIGGQCFCPSCGTMFKKVHYQQAFCKSKAGTQCKDKYWNNVTPNKRNNVTRISPANARYQLRMMRYKEQCFNPDDYEHPFSTESLGQW